jgi:serine protease AprX
MVSGAVAILLQDEPNLTPDQVKYRLMATANKSWAGYTASTSGAGYLNIYNAVYGTTTQSANTGVLPSQLLYSGTDPIAWTSVGWNSVGWNSVGWNSVGWNSVGWNSDAWDQ